MTKSEITETELESQSPKESKLDQNLATQLFLASEASEDLNN